jgi:isopenicillin-N N-acyltransferase-like protein
MDSYRINYRWLKWLAITMGIVMVLVVGFRLAITITPPRVASLDSLPLREEVGKDMYTCGDSWLKMNSYGLWEMYLKGDPYELGIKNGILAREQIHHQEDLFVSRLREMVPSDFYISFLKQVVIWMNRNLDHYIPQEYLKEIYGVARQASDTFSYIGPAYQRILNYHAAHDIGHALQNMNLVACTAMSVKGSRSADGNLLVGRNFDFSMGDEFARNKIVVFYEPDSGHRFVSITWGGMIGVVSGMNDQGLVVTLNAAKSGIPRSTKTPVSILARTMLQYASDIDEAFEIAAGFETFVSESFLVSSARDDRTVVIEKSPEKQALYEPEGEILILTNHFQSETFRNSELTLKNKAEGASLYRWERTLELLEQEARHDPVSFVGILRDRKGLADQDIGLGNEKAINQFVAHHSVVFEPARLRMWIAANPYQLGTYLCYDLERVFSDTIRVWDQIHTPDLSIGEDPFLASPSYANFLQYRKMTADLKLRIDARKGKEIPDEEIRAYLALNPHYYYPYYIAGELYRLGGDEQQARSLFRKALTMEIPRKVDREQVEEALESLGTRPAGNVNSKDE